MSSESITHKAARSVKWTALMEIVSRTASPIILVVLARLLSPDDFGLISIAMIAISFSQMIWDAGLSRALIQTQEAPEKAANVVFWTNLALGVIVYLIVFLSAPRLAVFFNSPRAESILRVLGLQIIIGSLASTQQSLFARDFDFKSLFWIRLATSFFPGVFSIPLAAVGWGPWALVAGTLAGSLLNLILLWRRSPWRPQLSYDRMVAKRLLLFGVWVMGESFGGWLITWGDILIVGKFLGAADLGVYRLGWTMCAVIFGLVLNPFLPVLYPSFARLQDDKEGLRAIFTKANRLVCTIALPTGVGLVLICPELVAVAFGSKWDGLGSVIQFIGAMFAVGWLVGINPEMYRGMGRPDINTKFLFAQLVLYLPAYLFAGPKGLYVFVVTRLLLAIVMTPAHVWVAHRVLALPVRYLWDDTKKALTAASLMSAAVLGVKFLCAGWYKPGTLLLEISVGALCYAGSLYLLDRAYVVNTFKTALRYGNA